MGESPEVCISNRCFTTFLLPSKLGKLQWTVPPDILGGPAPCSALCACVGRGGGGNQVYALDRVPVSYSCPLWHLWNQKRGSCIPPSRNCLNFKALHNVFRRSLSEGEGARILILNIQGSSVPYSTRLINNECIPTPNARIMYRYKIYNAPQMGKDISDWIFLFGFIKITCGASITLHFHGYRQYFIM